MPKLNKFKLVIETSDVEDAGTDATIFLAIGKKIGNVSTGKVYRLPDLPGDDNERGKTTVYDFTIPGEPIELEELGNIVLINGMNGDAPGWHVKHVTIHATGPDVPRGEEWCLVNSEINRWLDTKEAVGPAVVLPVKPEKVSEGSTGTITGALKIKEM